MGARQDEGPLFVALTADVDPDANRPAPGRPDAVSAGAADGVRLDACAEGLLLLARELGRRGLPATFFWEARTLCQLAQCQPELVAHVRANCSFEHACHGYRHEDFAGSESGVALGAEATDQALVEAGQGLAAVLGLRPRGFRAPYCRLTAELARALPRHGYVYDASLTRRPSSSWRMRPYRLPEEPAVWELALCRAPDPRGRTMSGYLWQLFEGNRPVGDYVHLIRSLRAGCSGGLLQIALHPWHVLVSANGQPLAGHGARLLAEFLDRAAAVEGVRFTGLSDYLAREVPAAAR